jgi:hypothetical protein
LSPGEGPVHPAECPAQYGEGGKRRAEHEEWRKKIICYDLFIEDEIAQAKYQSKQNPKNIERWQLENAGGAAADGADAMIDGERPAN